MNHKQKILKSYAKFTKTYDDLGWRTASFGGYEDLAVFLVSPKVYEEIEAINGSSLSFSGYESAFKNVLRKPENVDEFILFYVYNNEININSVELKPIVE